MMRRTFHFYKCDLDHNTIDECEETRLSDLLERQIFKSSVNDSEKLFRIKFKLIKNIVHQELLACNNKPYLYEFKFFTLK